MPVKIATTIKDKVQKLITENPHLRDNDEKLMANIWYQESEEKGVESLFDFLRRYSNGEFSNSESIRRIRQKIQETNPELRGSAYKNRTTEKVTEVRQDLGYRG